MKDCGGQPISLTQTPFLQREQPHEWSEDIDSCDVEDASSLTSTQTAALVELNVSAISLPSGICVAAEPGRRHHGRGNEACRPYREVVTTHVYTVPPHEGAPVRLSTPRRPLTGQRHGRARGGGPARARSAHVCPPNPTVSWRESPRQRLGVGTGAARAAQSAPVAREAQELAETRQEELGIATVSSRPPHVNRNHVHLRRVVHTAPGRTRRRDRGGECPASAAIQAGVIKGWGEEELRPPMRPRALSAPARGLAIYRAVDGCCQNLPSTPNFSRGARRFLEQWDRSSKVQRGQILTAMADHLLVSDDTGGKCTQRAGSRPADEPNGDAIIGKGGRDCSRDERITNPPAGPVSHPFHFVPWGGEPFAADRDFVSIQPEGPRESNSCQAAIIGSAMARSDRFDHHRVRVSAAKDMNRGFLELLGPHTGLFATRISSYLQTLHAWGHDLGPCLRVAALLANSTVPAERGVSCNATCSNLVQQLSNSGVVRVALAIIAAEDPRMAVHYSSKLEANQVEAMKLLLAIVRARGRHLKEHLTSPSFAGTHGHGDALGPMMIALRRSTCSVDARIAGGHLLVELGIGNPAGNGKVWNAIVCLLGQNETFREQLFGCRVALELLKRSDFSYADDDDLVCDSTSSHSLMRPQLILVPSVLSLALSDCLDVREAAGALAGFLTTISGPCCYVLVAGLVGFLGLVSGVERGASVAWIQQKWTKRTIHKETLGTRGVSTHSDDRCVVGIRGDESCTFREEKKTSEERFASGEGTNLTQSGGANSSHQQFHEDAATTKSVGGCGGSQTTEYDHVQRGHPKHDVKAGACDGNRLARSLQLLRRISTGTGRDQEVCSALASALAPLALLDLVVGAVKPPIERLVGSGARDRTSPWAGVGKTFVTQSRAVAEDFAGGSTDCELFGEKQAERQPSDKVELGCAQESPDQCDAPAPRQPACRAVAETLLDIYRRAGGHLRCVKVDPSAPTCEEEDSTSLLAHPKHSGSKFWITHPSGSCRGTLDLRGVFDAVLHGCSVISSSLCNGDAEAIARCFCRGDCDSDGTDSIGNFPSTAEIATLRKNIHALTKRLGRVKPPPSVRGSCTRRDYHDSHAIAEKTDKSITRTPENAVSSGSQVPSDVDQRLRSSVVNGGGADWRPATMAAPLRTDNSDQPLGLSKFSLDNTAVGRELLQMARRRRSGSSFASMSTVALRRKRRRPHASVSVVSSREAAAKGVSACGPYIGPSVWGPEDWGEEAPTMAMLVEPAVRQLKPSERGGGDRPGPIWRLIFGGGYESMQLANGQPSSRLSSIVGSEPADTLKTPPMVTPLPSTAATMRSVCALHGSKAEANNDIVQGVPHPPDKGQTGGTSASNRTYSRFRSNRLVAKKAPPSPQHPKSGRETNDGAGGESRKTQGRRGARRNQGRKVMRSFGTPANVASTLLRLSELPLLEQGVLEPGSESNAITAGEIENAPLDESSLGRPERGITPPVVQGSRIVKEAFELAERYPTTASSRC